MAHEPSEPEFSAAPALHDGEIVITVRGELDLATVPELGTAIDAALRIHPYVMILDLESVTFMDSTASGFLVEARTKAQRAVVDLKLRGITANCRRTLELLELDQLFTFVPDGDHPDGS